MWFFFIIICVIVVSCLITKKVKDYRAEKTKEHDRLLQDEEWCRNNPELSAAYRADKDKRDRQVYNWWCGMAVSISLNFGWYDKYDGVFICGRCDSAGGWDFKGTISNIGARTINYVYMTVIPYDRVGTRINDEVILKFTGPLNGTTDDCYWLHNWYDLPVAKIEFEEIRVEFAGGGEQIIKNGKIVRMTGAVPENVREYAKKNNLPIEW